MCGIGLELVILAMPHHLGNTERREPGYLFQVAPVNVKMLLKHLLVPHGAAPRI
jgi:hypothetical protein